MCAWENVANGGKDAGRGKGAWLKQHRGSLLGHLLYLCVWILVELKVWRGVRGKSWHVVLVAVGRRAGGAGYSGGALRAGRAGQKGTTIDFRWTTSDF